MPAYPISSTGISSTSTTQPLRQQSESAEANRLSASINGSRDADADSDDTGVKATQRVQGTGATVNARGERIGTTINTTA